MSCSSSSYRIRSVKILGRGSYGVVYLCHWEPYYYTLPFAMKAVLQENVEASRALAKEKRVYDVFRGYPGFTFCSKLITTRHSSGAILNNLILEYAPAGTLGDLIAATKGRGFFEGHMKSLVRDLLVGLDALHFKGYVHCDLKPGNILAFPKLGGLFELKLADFGLAKEPHEQLEREEWKGRCRGTRIYMSPESVRDGDISWQMDTWSLGCIILQMFTGRGSPWPTAIDSLSGPIFKSLLTCPGFEPLLFIPPLMSETGRDFLSKCLDKDPAKRWPASRLMRHPYVAPVVSEFVYTLDFESLILSNTLD